MCLGSGSSCPAPFLAGMLGCVCWCGRSACGPPFLAGVCCMSVWCCLPPAPGPWFVACYARFPGSRHTVAVVACYLSVCHGCGPQRAFLCPVVPRGAPRLVQSGRCWCAGRLSGRYGAFPYKGLSPPELLGGCAGHVEAGREPGSWCLPLAPAEAGLLASLRVLPVRGSAMGLSLAASSGVVRQLRVLRWFGVCTPGH